MHNRRYPFPFPAKAGKGAPDVATQLSNQVSDVGSKEREEETHLHPVPEHHHTIHLPALETLILEVGLVAERMKALLDDLYKARTFKDDWYPISANVGYEVNYWDRKFLFLYSLSAITLAIRDGGTIAVTANTWVNISLHRGAVLFAQGVNDVSPVTVLIRAMDDRMV